MASADPDVTLAITRACDLDDLVADLPYRGRMPGCRSASPCRRPGRGTPAATCSCVRSRREPAFSGSLRFLVTRTPGASLTGFPACRGGGTVVAVVTTAARRLHEVGFYRSDAEFGALIVPFVEE